VRAIAANRYGDNRGLNVADVEDPKLGPDTIIVRTRAAGLNPVDWKVLQGYLDGLFPVHFPLVPCWDLAGIVEAVGPAVTGFQLGDEVIAYDREDHIQWGTLAEFVSVPVRCAAPKPPELPWAEAAALPHAGLTAYQCVHDGLVLAPDHTVLVHGASGGVGSFAVQLAGSTGARVIGSASSGNHDYLRGLGVEPVSYGRRLVEEVLALAPGGVDAVVDLVGGAALDAVPALLKEGGQLVGVTDALRLKELGGRYLFAHPDAAQLTDLGLLAAKGDLSVHVSAKFAFYDAVAAFDQIESGHTRGKVVIEVDGG
jgi:NADPH:quinone reductase-like Zn-dependent oxidoreductase